MPISYKISPNRPLVVTYLWGIVTTDDVVQYYQALKADPDFDPAFWQLSDLRDVTVTEGDTSSVASAARVDVFARGVRRALIASTERQLAIARLFATYAEEFGHVVRVFREIHEAEAWLGA
jgi:hypothetical protein